jgi:hypothetical protein
VLGLLAVCAVLAVVLTDSPCCSLPAPFIDACGLIDDCSFTEKVGLVLAAAIMAAWEGWVGRAQGGNGSMRDVSSVGGTTQQQCCSKHINIKSTVYCGVAGFLRGTTWLGSCCWSHSRTCCQPGEAAAAQLLGEPEPLPGAKHDHQTMSQHLGCSSLEWCARGTLGQHGKGRGRGGRCVSAG